MKKRPEKGRRGEVRQEKGAETGLIQRRLTLLSLLTDPLLPPCSSSSDSVWLNFLLMLAHVLILTGGKICMHIAQKCKRIPTRVQTGVLMSG